MDDLLDQAPCGILLFNDEGKILKVNATLTGWLGYLPDELHGKSIDTILTLASRIFYNTHFFPLVKLQARADEIFFNLAGKVKKEIPVLSNTMRKLQDDAYVNISVFMPVYQRKKYEEEILHARRNAENALKENKALEAMAKDLEARTQELDRQYQRRLAIKQDIVQFSKIVSHDLQEPIRKIRLFADILGSADNEHIRRKTSALEKIQSSVERLAQLTVGLQQYVNIDDNDNSGEIDLNDLFAGAKRKVMQDRNLEALHVERDPLPSIEGYAEQIELLFYHLLDNAIKFRSPERDLKVNIQATLLEENLYRSIVGKYRFAEHLRIVFSDNGVGFDDQYKNYVFELVKKIDLGKNGLGIGLALIKKIADNHSGIVRVESEQGKGTSVILILPLKMKSKMDSGIPDNQNL